MIEGTVEQIVKVTAPKISIFYRIILVIACLLAATTIVQTGWLGVIVLVIFIFFTVFVFEYYNAEYEYSYKQGDIVHINSMDFVVRSVDGDNVVIADVNYPLM